jgi:hypothetical protein
MNFPNECRFTVVKWIICSLDDSNEKLAFLQNKLKQVNSSQYIQNIFDFVKCSIEYAE